MLIVADHKIPFLAETFGCYGEVLTYPSTKLTPEVVAPADVLLVRSETKVDSNLIEGSRVRFVGSPTIGVDHIDLSYLHHANVPFSNAPGCNARSVVEYVLTALACLAERSGESLRGKTLGIVGVGNIGSRLAKVAPCLGIEVLLNDPPRKLQDPSLDFRELEELLEADFVTLHVPLETRGPFPTFHLIGETNLARLRPETVLINSSRGSVVDNKALLKALNRRRIRGTILDVWEGEPQPNLDLMDRVDLATPHIAGYSLDGKMRGTWTVYQAFGQALGLDLSSQHPPELPAPKARILSLESELEVSTAVYRLLQQAYPIGRDDRKLRGIRSLQSSEEQSRYFRSLRSNYPLRREFAAFEHRPGRVPGVDQVLRSLGFRLSVAQQRPSE